MRSYSIRHIAYAIVFLAILRYVIYRFSAFAFTEFVVSIFLRLKSGKAQNFTCRYFMKPQSDHKIMRKYFCRKTYASPWRPGPVKGTHWNVMGRSFCHRNSMTRSFCIKSIRCNFEIVLPYNARQEAITRPYRQLLVSIKRSFAEIYQASPISHLREDGIACFCR